MNTMNFLFVPCALAAAPASATIGCGGPQTGGGGSGGAAATATDGAKQASALQKTDWLFPSYRDFGMALYHGVPMAEMLHNMFGNALDSAKGRQMPVHFSFVAPIKFVSISSPIGTHLPQAVGAAYAMKLRGEKTVAVTSFGDGGTSSLGFHSGMNFAAVWKAPVVFLCQNNQWAISCPSSGQTASESYAIKAKAYGMPGVLVDGNDLATPGVIVRHQPGNVGT